MKIAAIDLETTGDDPSQDVPIEVGVVFLGRYISKYHSLLHPGDRKISPVASAVHHITEKSFRDKSSVAPSQEYWETLLGDQDYLVAHNASFDSQFIPLGKPWICTYRCAMHIYPDAPKFSLQTLRYWLKLNPVVPGDLHPHRALYDAICLHALLKKMMKKHSPAELHKMTYDPLLLKKLRFGKHRGEDFADVPSSYLEWILKKDFDEDTKFTARHHLNGRKSQENLSNETPADTLAVN